MRIKAAAIIIIVGLTIAITSQFCVAIDTPHNESNNVYCGGCHVGPQFLESPYWFPIYTPQTIDDTPFNMLCLSCHVASSGPYTDTSAPRVKTHSSVSISNKYGDWTRECIHCHKPHKQLQKNYKSTDAGILYLAQGAITSCVYNGDGTSTLSYSSITYKTGWDDTKLTKKNGDYRYTVLWPDVNKLNYDYPIMAVDSIAKTIKVKGNASTSFSPPTTFAVMYGQYVKTSIEVSGTYKTVKFFDRTGTNSFADGDGTYNGICEVCHTLTAYHRNDATGDHAHYAGTNCISCHTHSEGFAHGGGGTGCDACHGHDAGWQGNANLGKGTFKSHSTHTENDSDDLRGPNLTCGTCHDTNNFPRFSDGQDLTGTTVCDGCHSSGGVFNGVNTASGSVGAKENWASGVYSGSVLTAGKEKWCVGCHDLGVSVIGGRQAPNVAGNNTTYGYYVSGHGSPGTECGACHGLDMNHNFDNKRTYASASNNYKQGYRLKDVTGTPYGPKPMNIPAPATGGVCSYNAGDYNLCFKCHSESDLISDPKGYGTWNCVNTKTGIMKTQFRNETTAGFYFHLSDLPANIHWDHLVDADKFIGMNYWKSDGVASSRTSCVTCHNPHGDFYGAGTLTVKMTRGDFQITWGTDVNGDYGLVAGANAYNSNRCAFACHGTNTKYYRSNPYPKLDSISVADNNASDPTPAEAGYTNNRNVGITVTYSGNAPSEMIFAEDNAFTTNSTGWIAYSPTYTYTLTTGEGSKTVYGRLRNASGSSSIKSAVIVLDQTSPTVPATTIISPNGGEVWNRGTNQNITWNSGGITDTNLKANPLSLAYSTNSGVSYPNTIATGEANDGTYQWTLPVIESTQVKVKLTASDRAGNQASDISNNDFTIRSIAPVLSGISIADNNNADPAPAEAGYTNNQSVEITISASNFPTEMIFAEDAAFTVNSTGWIFYATPYTYSLTASNGTKTVYAKIRNGGGESSSQNNTIILDTINPSIQVNTLTAPNGSEFWMRGSSQSITWTSSDITDANPKTNPIKLDYSTDSGASYPNTIATDESNDGSYSWSPLPTSVSYLAKVRITATDRAGNQSSDSSNNNFYISTPYIVTNTNDSGAGSLRQVITDLVAAGGNDTIWFNIPSSSLTNGVAVINIASSLPQLSQSGIVIDGASQTALVGNTNLNGPEVRLHGPGAGSGVIGIDITASGGTVRSLQITGMSTAFQANQSGAVLSGSHIGFASDSTGYNSAPVNGTNIAMWASSVAGVVGGSSSGDGNYISCAWYYGLSDQGNGNQVINNVFGLLPNGTNCSNYTQILGPAVYLNGADNVIFRGNTICGSEYGVYLDSTATGNVIKGNTFGVWYSGGTWNDCNDSTEAITLWNLNVSNNTIGGPLVATDDANLNDSNVIDPGFCGIRIRAASFAAPGNFIYGNFIGTNPQKTMTFPGTYGVDVGSIWQIAIGGSGAGEAGNVIANMTSYGVYLSNAAAKYIKISRNSFYNNGDNAGDDAIYMVAGANEGITRPTITAASVSTVTVDGVASGDVVEVYKSDYDGSGAEYGEGKTFVGSATASGTSVSVSVSELAVGDWVTALRTNSFNDTSPFSSNFQVQ